MSDDESSTSDTDGEPADTLVTGREKRSTAGNRLSQLIQHFQDEDVQADLLEEDEDDLQDYSASGEEDGDIALDSSDDDEDAGPPKDGDEQDLEGEQELRKQERVESKRKRKAHDTARIQPMRKRVKIVEITDRQEAEQQEVPSSKKLHRPAQFSSEDHTPVRQSSRAHTIANAKVTKAKLKESQKRAVKTQEVMRLAAEKKAAEAGPALTQADRMARALEIEKENSSSLNKWEESEQERLQLQREKLEAMRNRKLEGPVMRYWSGPVMWKWREGPEGPVNIRMTYKITRKNKVEELNETENAATQSPEVETRVPVVDARVLPQDLAKERLKSIEQPATVDRTNVAQVFTESQPNTGGRSIRSDPLTAGLAQGDALLQTPPAEQASLTLAPDAQTSGQGAFLDGIHLYAASVGASQVNADGTTTAPMGQSYPATTPDMPRPSMPPYHHVPSQAPQELIEPLAPPPPPLPLMREKAARSLLVLESFPSLDELPEHASSRRTAAALTSNAITQAITSILLPDSQPTLTAEERKYLTTAHKKVYQRRESTMPPQLNPITGIAIQPRQYNVKEKEDLMPPAPSRPLCALTGKKARFKDPKTGLCYKDVVAYKAIQRVMAGGTQWSPLLGAWSGIVGEGALGRVARGVPEGFWKGKPSEAKSKEQEVEEVKKEDGDRMEGVVS